MAREIPAYHHLIIICLDELSFYWYRDSMNSQQRPLFWVGNSYKELMALPDEIIDIFGFALGLAQRGEKHDAAKPLKEFGGAGVLEVVAGDEGGTYRAVYTVTFPEAVFVLHCFQKKSKKGSATPKETLEVIHARLKTTEKAIQEMRRGKDDR